MVNNTIHATYTETYDVNTLLNELSLLAIHTPQAPSLKRMFHGFFEQYSKFKILGCNFRMVCATKQELSPIEAGSEAGQIDPRNVLNPILFKACTGEHIDSLCDQIYNRSEEVASAGAYGNGGSISQHIDTSDNAIRSYYSLLADDSWRKEHPQAGITVMGLKPMVHKVVTTQPFKWSVAPSSIAPNGVVDIPQVAAGSPTGTDSTIRGFGGQSGSNVASSDTVNPSVFVSNGLTEMPWLDTSYTALVQYRDNEGAPTTQQKASKLCANVPRVYMGCLILPPSIGANSANLYYRIQINWHVLFKDFRTVQDLMPIVADGTFVDDSDQVSMQSLSAYKTYFNMYHTASKLQKDYGSFDTAGIESVDKILEKGQ